MKLLIIIAVSVFSMKTINSFSQSVSINNDGSLPNASAMLDIKSGTKGILIPRTSTSTRITITGAKGLLLYDTTSSSFWYHTGATWTELGSAAPTGWLLSGNSGTNASTEFIGTIDNQPLSFRQNNKWLGKLNALNSNYSIGAGAGENNVTGINNTAIGDSAGFTATAVSHNVLIGKNAGRNNTGSWTTIVGIDAGQRNQSNGNVFIGSASGMKNITGFQNTFVGDNAGREDSTGYDNSFFGSYAGQYSSGSENSFFGALSGTNNRTGFFNSFFGSISGLQNNTGGYNSFFGYQAGRHNTAGNYNIFIGPRAGYNNLTGSGSVAIGNAASYTLSGAGNILNLAIGDSAGFANTSSENTFMGGWAGRNNTSGFANTFIGTKSGFSNNNGNSNIFLGKNSGYNNTSGRGSIAIGNAALFSMTGGFNQYNTAIGDSSFYSSINNTTFGYMRNTGVGNSSGRNNVNGVENTFIGARAGFSNDSSIRNTFIGADAGYSLRSTFNGYNSFVGALAGASMTSGQGNSIVGAYSAFNKVSGYDNVYMGYQAGYNDISGVRNTSIGAYAGLGTNGAGTLSHNVFVGTYSGYECNANYNTFLGVNSGSVSTTGTQNVFVGGSVLSVRNTIGNRNTFLGSEAGYENISGNNNSIIGFQADLLSGNLSNATAIGAYARVDESNCLVLGGIAGINGAIANTNVGIGTTTPHAPLQFQNALANRKIVMWETVNNDLDFFGFGINSATLRYQIPAGGNVHRFFAGNTALLSIFSDGNATLAGSLTQLSDARLKQHIIPLSSTINALKKINAYSYYWKDINRDKDQQIGLLAQEVDKVFPQLVKKDTAGLMSVNYSGFVPLLIKGMQEQQEMIEYMQKRMELLEEQNKKLLQLMEKK